MLSLKAKRSLVKKEAAKYAGIARKFRADSLKLGVKLCAGGTQIYRFSHPVYEEFIQPLLEEAEKIAKKNGFNVLFQVQTPMETMPYFTSCLASIDMSSASPTMKDCVELIQSRPVAKLDSKGEPIYTEKEKPLFNETTIELAAKAIYAQWKDEHGFVEWFDGGNSNKQVMARSIAKSFISP